MCGRYAVEARIKQRLALEKAWDDYTGYYEWTQTKPKIPYFIHPIGDEPLLVAGIWDRWRDEDRVALIVGAANKGLEHIHHRMPVIVPMDRWQDWLHGETPAEFLHPHPDGLLDAHTVSTAVNKPGNNGPALITPASP